jgi:RES domain-containing protein
MAAARPARDSLLLDVVEALPREAFDGTVWRVVRTGRDPIQCSATGGRWDDRTFDVLYTSLKADGAVSEMYYHVSRGQPVIPSLIRYRLHELKVTLASCARVASLDVLAAMGLATSSFGQLSYFERVQEYPRTQEIAEAAHFHGRDGLLVPSARSEHFNLVVFCDPAGPEAIEVVRDHGEIDWGQWRAMPLGY